MSAGNIINFTNITFAINFAFQIVLQFNLFWLEIMRFAISVIDNNLNSFISSNFLVKIGILFVLFILSRRTLRFVYKLFTLKSNIVSNKPSEPENNDKAIDIDEFVAIYKYKNRGGFVNLLEDLTSISKLIISAPNPNSPARTICIDGKWGTGKTSYINILKGFSLERLGNTLTSVENITINSQINKNELIWEDKFQPWNFGNSSEMMTEFFKVLSEKTVEAGLSVSPWRSWKYNDYASLASSIFEKNTFAQSAFKLLFPPKNMPKLKEEICKDLQKLTKKIVFVLDDTDREHPEMVLEVMRLIKSVADFPNLIFILPFDYNKVSSIITKKYGEEYQNYLQKIISYPCPINNYSYEDLYSIFMYEFRNSDHLWPILEQIYEYYRIQVWLIGFRKRIDWLVSAGKLVYENNNYRIEQNKFSEIIYICEQIQTVSVMSYYNEMKISGLIKNNDYSDVVKGGINKLIKTLYTSFLKIAISKIDNINVSLNVVDIDSFSKNFSKDLMIIHKEYMEKAARTLQNLELEREAIQEVYKSLNETKDYIFTNDEIKASLQEFAPNPRDIKVFARKVLTKKKFMLPAKYEGSSFIPKGKSMISNETIFELDKIILNEHFYF